MYYSADIAGDTWGYLTTYSYPSASADGQYNTHYIVSCAFYTNIPSAHVSWKVEPFIPMIQWDGLNTDIISFVKARIPLDEVVYNRLGIPEAKRGRGLQHAMPDPPRGGEPRCSMSTLIHLALLSTPRKCLLGYEIVAILMGHFRYFRTTDQDWKVCDLNTTTGAVDILKHALIIIAGTLSCVASAKLVQLAPFTS